MRTAVRRLAALALPLVLAAGCEQSKSSSPLSPEVAGPMAGISIDPPVPASPGAGLQIPDTQQPVSLVINNPATNSPRAIQLSVQVALDSGFTNVVFSQTNVTPAQGAQTTVPLSGSLPNGRTYYWRTSATDGANASGWSDPVFFQILQPIVIGVPTLRSPIGGARVSNTTPVLDVADGASSGPHSALHYQFQVSDNQAFANPFVNDSVGETAGETTDTVTFLTAWNITNYWRVRIFDDAGHVGNWSNVETFLSPVAPVIAPKLPSPGGGGGSRSFDVSACNSLTGNPPQLVQCIRDTIQPTDTLSAFEVVKRVAWALRGQGAGLMIKDGGENVVSWQGYSFSASRIEFSNFEYFKVLSDVGDGGSNGASWSDEGEADHDQYVPAIDPSLP